MKRTLLNRRYESRSQGLKSNEGPGDSLSWAARAALTKQGDLCPPSVVLPSVLARGTNAGMRYRRGMELRAGFPQEDGVRPVILDVGGGTGAWSEPYRRALYDVRIIDPAVWPFWSARSARYNCDLERVHGLLLAPPCTELAGSGARWWAVKPAALLEAAIEVVRDMLALVDVFQPAWWALENPVGRIARVVPELGPYRYTWQPWEFGDAETKRTCMWGAHSRPVPTVTEKPTEIDARVWRMAPSEDRARLRSITPRGFAEAFFKANP